MALAELEGSCVRNAPRKGYVSCLRHRWDQHHILLRLRMPPALRRHKRVGLRLRRCSCRVIVVPCTQVQQLRQQLAHQVAASAGQQQAVAAATAAQQAAEGEKAALLADIAAVRCGAGPRCRWLTRSCPAYLSEPQNDQRSDMSQLQWSWRVFYSMV